MATIKGARTVALAAAMAGGMLCEPLICDPAKAATSELAFEYTQSSSSTTAFFASLELFNGSSLVDTLTTQGFQGWVSNLTSVPPSVGGSNGGNNGYTVGNTGTMLLADYFGFNMKAVPASLTVTSAILVVRSGTINTNLKLNLVAATQYAGELLTPPIQSPTLYNELVNGTNGIKNVSYGIFSVSANTTGASTMASATNAMAELMFTLNAAAVTEINAQIQAGGPFVVSGSVTDVPEPSTWVMMLAGFAGLGVLARRRAARRRAAAEAG